MERTFRYAQLLLIGISATTISAAVIGQPLPVVGPAVAAGVLVAAHHVHSRERGRDVDDRPGHTSVYPDGGQDDPDGSLGEWIDDRDGGRA